MESLARLVALMALTSTGVGAAIGGVAANKLAKRSPHRTAYTVGGVILGGVAGFSALIMAGRWSASAPVQTLPEQPM